MSLPFFHQQSLIRKLGRKLDRSLIGNKAANLLRLQQLGMRVPKTYVITNLAYVRYLQDDLSVVENLIREVEKIIKPGQSYAVRSSANLEDSFEHSFAGQFKSLLDVRDPRGVMQAVWAVWATACTPEVQSYLMKRSLDENALHMAVIIQEMVRPVCSGVVFSRNPLTGLRETVVEAVTGKGTRLVQEGVTPLRWISHGGKYTACPVDDAVPQVVIDEIVQTTRKIAKQLRRDVDMEWVYDGAQLYWVQMREITTLQNAKVYSNSISQEMLGGMIKPLIWSINIPLVGGVWVRLISELMGPNRLSAEELVRAFHFRAYFNMGLLGEVFEDLGFPAESLEIMWGLTPELEQHANKPQEKVKMMPAGMPPIWKLLRRAPRFARFARKMWTLPKTLQQRLTDLASTYRSIDPAQAALGSPKELLDSIDNLYRLNQEAAYLNVVVPLSMYAYSTALRRQLTKIGVNLSDVDLEEDSEDFRRYDPNYSLGKLRDMFSRMPIDTRRRLQEAAYEEMYSMPGMEDFQTGMKELIRSFGHLSDNGNDFSMRPWREDPDAILRLVTNAPAVDSRATELAQPKVGKTHFHSLKLPPIRRQFLQFLFTRARQFQLYREQISYVYTLGYGLFRVYFLALAAQFVERGWIISREDIFYLTLNEIRAAVACGEAESLREKAASRKQEMGDVKDVQMPQVIFGDNPPPVKRNSGKVLRGTATSRGYCSGPVRVVSGLNDFPRVQAGDVLAIPFSDVSWTPLFARAAGVIAESGGMLSHSSIVAREYGIPAVVSVAGATSLVDGTLVTVDGFTGEIILHEGGSFASPECQ